MPFMSSFIITISEDLYFKYLWIRLFFLVDVIAIGSVIMHYCLLWTVVWTVWIWLNLKDWFMFGSFDMNSVPHLNPSAQQNEAETCSSGHKSPVKNTWHFLIEIWTKVWTKLRCYQCLKCSFCRNLKSDTHVNAGWTVRNSTAGVAKTRSINDCETWIVVINIVKLCASLDFL